MKLKSTIVILLLMITGTIFAQKGTLIGVIQDKEFNDVLPFANVIVKGTNNGTTTDFEGAYELTMEPGNYVIVFSFIGYETVEVTDVVINPGKVTELNTSLGPLSNQLDEVVVSVKTAEKYRSIHARRSKAFD